MYCTIFIQKILLNSCMQLLKNTSRLRWRCVSFKRHKNSWSSLKLGREAICSHYSQYRYIFFSYFVNYSHGY